eukprot:5972244-Pleurochrysis_carterae.AAC.3
MGAQIRSSSCIIRADGAEVLGSCLDSYTSFTPRYFRARGTNHTNCYGGGTAAQSQIEKSIQRILLFGCLAFTWVFKHAARFCMRFVHTQSYICEGCKP